MWTHTAEMYKQILGLISHYSPGDISPPDLCAEKKLKILRLFIVQAEEDAGAAAQDGYLSPLQLARLSVKAQLYTRVKRQQNQITLQFPPYCNSSLIMPPTH